MISSITILKNVSSANYSMNLLRNIRNIHYIRLTLSALIFFGSMIINLINQYLLAKYLIENDYGSFMSSRSLITISSTIICLGIPYAIVIVLSEVERSRKDLYQVISYGVRTILLGVFIITPIVFLYVNKQIVQKSFLLIIITLIGILNYAFLNLAEGIFQGLRRSHLASIMAFSNRGVFFVLLIVFVKDFSSFNSSLFMYVISSIPISFIMFLVIFQLIKTTLVKQDFTDTITFKKLGKLGVTLLISNSFLTITIQLPIIIAGVISTNLAARLGVVFTIVNTVLIFMIFMSNNLMAYTFEEKTGKKPVISYETIAKIDLLAPAFAPTIFSLNPLLNIFLKVIFPKYIDLTVYINLLLLLLFTILLLAPSKVILTKTKPIKDLYANLLSFAILLISLIFWVLIQTGIREIIVIWCIVLIINRAIKQGMLAAYYNKKYIYGSLILIATIMSLTYFFF